MAGGGQAIDRDGLRDRCFAVNFKKPGMCDGGVLVEGVGSVAGAAEISCRGIAACLGAEAVADAIIDVAEIPPFERCAGGIDGFRGAGDFAGGIVAITPRTVIEFVRGGALIQIIERIFREIGGLPIRRSAWIAVRNRVQQATGGVMESLMGEICDAVGTDHGRQCQGLARGVVAISHGAAIVGNIPESASGIIA